MDGISQKESAKNRGNHNAVVRRGKVLLVNSFAARLAAAAILLSGCGTFLFESGQGREQIAELPNCGSAELKNPRLRASIVDRE